MWLLNQDNTQGAFWGQNEAGDGLTENYSSEGVTAIWYTLPNGETFPGENTNIAAYTDSKEELSWNYVGNSLRILSNEKLILEENFEGTLGNWAAFTKLTDSYSVKYYDVDNNKIKEASNRTAKIGEEVSVTEADKIIQGYAFDEKNDNNRLTATVTKDGNTALKLYFDKNAAPVDSVYPGDSVDSKTDTENISNGNTEINENPKTGDSLRIYIILFIVSTLGILGFCIKKKIFNRK